MPFAAIAYGAEITRTIYTLRPVAIVLFPIAAALVVALLGAKRGRYAALFSLGAAVFTFLGVLSFYPLLRQGIMEHYFYELMGVGLLFRVDYLGFIFALLISLAWLLAMLHAQLFLEQEGERRIYLPSSLITLGSCLGVVLTGDLFSLFLFYELLTFSSYVLKISRSGREAIIAGRFALYMGLAGGLVTLFGIIFLYYASGTVKLVPLMDIIGDGNVNASIIFACLFTGFAIKAVAVPLNLLIPKPYAASSAAVNTLYAWALINVGVYGILRLLFIMQ